MINITFLVGNGFDISAGLRTKYSDFYEWYCNLPMDGNESQYLRKFKNSIQSYVDRIHSTTISEDETWADFELGLAKYTDQFTKDNGTQFIECKEDALNHMILYLKQQQTLFDITAFSDDDIERICTQIRNFYLALPPVGRNYIKGFFEPKLYADTIIKFISFNYTDVLDKVIDKISNFPLKIESFWGIETKYSIDPTVLHIHGDLNEYPILAVDNESQIKNQDMLDIIGFKESMIKAAGIDAIDRDWHIIAEKIIDTSDIICIWGMSLGATDRKWWNKISFWLQQSNKRRLIIFYYLAAQIGSTSIIEYVTNKKAVIDKFFSHSDLSEEEKELIKKQIYVVFNDNKVLQLYDLSQTVLTL